MLRQRGSLEKEGFGQELVVWLIVIARSDLSRRGDLVSG